MTAFTAVANSLPVSAEYSKEGKDLLVNWVLFALLAVAMVMVVAGAASLDLALMIPAGILAAVSAMGISFYTLLK